MEKVVPHAIDYALVSKVDKLNSYVLYVSAVLSLCVILNNHVSINLDKEQFNDVANRILGILGIAYFLIDMMNSYLFQNAEANRKNDFINNSLNTQLSDKNSKDYFSNDSIDIGIYKLGVNCFENCFFSKFVSSKMILPMVVKSFVILLLYLFVLFFTDQNTTLSVFQISLPFTIINQTIKLILLNSNLSLIAQNFRNIFSSTEKAKQDSLVINNVINYEKTLSSFNVQLDTKLFDKNNDKLSLEWERIKQSLNIK